MVAVEAAVTNATPLASGTFTMTADGSGDDVILVRKSVELSRNQRLAISECDSTLSGGAAGRVAGVVVEEEEEGHDEMLQQDQQTPKPRLLKGDEEERLFWKAKAKRAAAVASSRKKISSMSSSLSSPCSSTTASLCSTDEDDASSSTATTSTSLLLQNMPVPLSPPDIYGQRHPIETTELVQSKLHDFDVVLKMTNEFSNNQSLQLAQERCSTTNENILTDSFKLMFLRCEVFDVQKAARRYAKYWAKRIEVFGESRAFSKLSIHDGDELVSLQTGALRILRRPTTTTREEEKDERDFLYLDPGQLQPTLYSREAALRAFWCLFHSLLEDEQVQKRGFIVVCNSSTFSWKNRDPCFTRMCAGSWTGCLPIRLSAFHMCPPPHIYRIIVGFLLCFVSDRLRKRVVVVHPMDSMADRLESKYGFAKSIIPIALGGAYEFPEMQQWVADRRAVER